MRRAALLLTIASLAAAPAYAQNDQAWNDWVYRANSILGAIASGEQDRVNLVCRNIVREMMAKAALPLWARELVGTCSALKEGLGHGRSNSFCRQARENARALGKAAPVAEEPRAYPIAMQLSEAMNGLYKGMC